MADKLMKALQCDSYGGGAAGLKHVEVQVPIPKPSKVELLLKLEATSINPIDWKIQKGMLRPLFPLKFPWIPREVLDVGPGVKNFKVGDKVLSMLDIFNVVTSADETIYELFGRWFHAVLVGGRGYLQAVVCGGAFGGFHGGHGTQCHDDQDHGCPFDGACRAFRCPFHELGGCY